MDAPKILVVEDDEPVAAMLCILLDVAGYGCVRTADAERGWTEARLGTLGAAVIDLRLPGRDGWWLIEKLREQAGTHSLPIVVVTGFLDEEVARRAGELGCASLGKPFSFTELTAALKAAATRSAALPK